MKNNYLAVDIGASSGRHIIGRKNPETDVLEFTEIFRFPNGMENKDGRLCWNINKLFENVKLGLKECKKTNVIPFSMGIDTWGCDFVLLDKDNQLLENAVAYRDSRTNGFIEKVNNIISFNDLYQRTGIQKQPFNTIYQLMSIKENQAELLSKVESFLTIPDYLNFLLTGKKCNEYTNATTTGLVNLNTKDWDWEVIEKLGLPEKIFQKILMPGTLLGTFTEEIQKEIGFNCNVVLPCCHDTGSAIAALPVSAEDKNSLYISSGTWSLLGTELQTANASHQSQILNYTNEGGYNGRIRFLKNIMGLWMIQSVKKEIEVKEGRKIAFDELDQQAREADIKSIVACNDSSFLSPESMIAAVQKFCQKRKMKVPLTNGELVQVIYASLAKSYADAIKELEQLLDCKFTSLKVIGGGSRSTYLNELTQKETGIALSAGPSEATAIGNCLVQMLWAKEFADLEEARLSVKKYIQNGGK